MTPGFAFSYPFQKGKGKVADICETVDAPGSNVEYQQWIRINDIILTKRETYFLQNKMKRGYSLGRNPLKFYWSG